MQLIGNSIVLSSILLEGILIISFYIWAISRGYPFVWYPSSWELLLGLIFSIPLFALNYLVFGPNSHKVSWLKNCFEFKDKIVRPLAESLNYKTSLIVAICAGLGEELFFRGLLQNEIGIFGAAIFFAVLHFGPAVKKYFAIVCLYFLIGIYFSLLTVSYESLWTAIIPHIFYDYIALLYMRYIYRSPEKIISQISTAVINGVRPL